MALENILEQIGLTVKEAAVYLAVLEIGRASVLRIAHKAGVKRPTAYVTLHRLHAKGFVDAVPKGSTTLYQAIDPEKILNLFDEKLSAFKNVLPELRSLINAAPNKPRVRFYEGKKSILALYENEIFRAKEIIGAVSIKDVLKMLTVKEEIGFLHLMKANGGAIREFIEDSPEAREYLKEKNRLALGETKFLPADMRFNVDVLVYENTVAMIAPKNMIAVLIEDSAIASAHRQFLEFLWRNVKSV